MKIIRCITALFLGALFVPNFFSEIKSGKEEDYNNLKATYVLLIESINNEKVNKQENVLNTKTPTAIVNRLTELGVSFPGNTDSVTKEMALSALDKKLKELYVGKPKVAIESNPSGLTVSYSPIAGGIRLQCTTNCNVGVDPAYYLFVCECPGEPKQLQQDCTSSTTVRFNCPENGTVDKNNSKNKTTILEKWN